MSVNVDGIVGSVQHKGGRIGAVLTGWLFIILGALVGDTDAHGIAIMIGGMALIALGWLAPYVERVIIAWKTPPADRFAEVEAVHKRLAELEEDARDRIEKVTEELHALNGHRG